MKLFLLLVLASVFYSVASVTRKIAAFNIQTYGPTKAGKPDVMDELCQILKRYDIVLIQEIRNADGTAIVQLLDQLNSESDVNGAYSMEIGPRLGRSSYKEQYCYFYKHDFFTILDSETYNDAKDIFEREPMNTLFRDLDSGKEFVLSGIHVKPDDAPTEIDELTTVYDSIESTLGTSDVIILGDLNADCSYVSSKDWNSISLRQDVRFDWLIPDSADTTVSTTDCAYDRFVSAGTITSSIQSASVYNFESDHNLSNSFAKEVSDHYPVEITITY
ncbi:deoxyribonuclease-1-like [Apostichopus japonicus]|uniref:deoxyribonuclease-1-like n=1 Tax=Stichopus japonicus TaxID=307972 RepID=UPI003AB6E4FC